MPQARITAPMKGRVSRVYGMLVVLHMCGQSVHYMGTFLLEAYDLYNVSLHLYEYGVLKKKRKKIKIYSKHHCHKYGEVFGFDSFCIVHIIFFFVTPTGIYRLFVLLLAFSVCLFSSASSSGIICVLRSFLEMSTGWRQTSQELRKLTEARFPFMPDLGSQKAFLMSHSQSLSLSGWAILRGICLFLHHLAQFWFTRGSRKGIIAH